jgi:hypothetical protein
MSGERRAVIIVGGACIAFALLQLELWRREMSRLNRTAEEMLPLVRRLAGSRWLG